MEQTTAPLQRFWTLVHEQKSDITAIYFYAILSGIIQLTVPLSVQAIIGFVLGGIMTASLVVLISILVLSVLLSGIMQIRQMKIIEKIKQKIFVKNSYDFADRIPKLDLKEVDSYYLPELVNRFFDTMTLQKSISKLLLDLPTAFIQIIFGLVLLSLYHPFFIIFSILLLGLLWLILYTTGRKGLASSLQVSTNKYAVVAWLEELSRLVKSFKFSYTSGLHIKKANDKTIKYLQARTSHFSVLLFQYKSLVAFKVIITAALMIVGVILLLNQQLNIGQFVAAEIIIITVINSVEKIIVNLNSVYDSLTAVEKLSKLTDKPIETGGTLTLLPGESIEIEANNLTFGYYPGKQILKDISFKVMPSETVCIKGKDGVGKSTLLKLLTGTYKNFDGSLLINNIPIGNYDLLSLREKTGILFPNEDIFHGTLWENITMGNEAIDKSYVTHLCTKTGLISFVASLFHGFDTELDPTGRRLPRNVIQKILLVRALATKPKLLLLEEPWQGVEEQYRQGIQQLILEAKDTTVLVSTNDEAFGKLCDHTIHL